MTKEPSRKQVIISISNNNKVKFILDFSAHITNINKVLKYIKSEIKADYIQLETTGIIIITNKVTFPLNLQTMK